MRDMEFIEFRNKIVISIVVLIIFAIPFLLFISNKFLKEDSPVIKAINKSETLLIFIEEESCKSCDTINNRLKEYNVEYFNLNIDKNADYKRVLHKLKIPSKNIKAPTLIYVEEGSLYAELVDIQSEEEFTGFLRNYGFIEE